MERVLSEKLLSPTLFLGGVQLENTFYFGKGFRVLVRSVITRNDALRPSTIHVGTPVGDDTV